MIWYWIASLVAGTILIVFAAIKSLEKNIGFVRFAWSVLYLALATIVLYFPIFALSFDTLTAIIKSVFNIFQVISLDADYTEYYTVVMQSIGITFLAKTYMVLLGILHLLLPVASLMALYNMLIRFLSSVKVLIVNLKKSPVYIFSEKNAFSLELGKNIREKNKKADIIFVGADDEENNHDISAQNNFLFHHGDIINLNIKTKGKECYFFCIGEQDDNNLNNCLMLIEKFEKLEKKLQKQIHIYLFSEQDETETMVDSTNKGSLDIHIDRPSELSIYELFDKYPLYLNAEKKQINLLLVGFSDYIKTSLRTACWIGQMANYQLQVHIYGENIENDILSFSHNYPGLFTKQYNLHCVSCNNNHEMLEKIAKECSDATYVIVDIGNETRNVELAIALRRLFYRAEKDFENEPLIHVHITGEGKDKMISNLKTSELKKERRVSYKLIPFGAPQQIYTYDNILHSSLDSLSKNVHLAYSEIFSDEAIDIETAMDEFNAIEMNKRSNRANAMHIRYKLAALGLDYEETTGENDDVEYDKYLTEKTLDELTKAEHRRWNAFEESEGWIAATLEDVQAYQNSNLSGGKHQCQLLKMHPYIIPFEELAEVSNALNLPDSTIYDIELIKRIPDILHDKWNISEKKYRIIKKERVQ